STAFEYLLPIGTKDPNESRVHRGDCRSVQLKIKRHRRNHLDRLAVHPSRFRPPLLDSGDSGIGQRRLAFKKFLHLDAAVLLHPHLELHETLQARALRERRIRWLWEIDEALLEII